MVDDRRYDFRNSNRDDDDRHGPDRGYYSGNAARDYGAGRSQGSHGDQEDHRERNFRGGGTGYGGGSRYAQQSYGPQQGGRGDTGYRGAYAEGRDSRNERGGSGRQPEGYRYEDRGFLDRAGDEVRSWFGDDEAERRREFDQRHEEGRGGSEPSRGRPSGGHHPHDANYHSWRQQQIEQLDRDYDEYRRENQSRFHSEFSSWRTERQTQRGSLGSVQEHMEVVGSDGGHVGTVDKVSGDRIILTRTDPDAGGHHHSIPSRWIERVADKVAIRKTAEEAKAHWRDEERSGSKDDQDQDSGRVNLDRSFRGTY